MIRVCLSAAFAAALSSIAFAWPVADLNRTIDQTNFVVAGHCSGTLISLEPFYILTNHHCITDKPMTVSQSVLNKRGERVQGVETLVHLVASDPDVDLALLVAMAPLPNVMAAPLGHTVTRGEVAFVVGNPAMLEASVTRGIVSHIRREIRIGQRTLVGFQVDSGIYGGNSGGAVYNDAGELIGVPAAAMQGAWHIGFAIHIDTVRQFLTEAGMKL